MRFVKNDLIIQEKIEIDDARGIFDRARPAHLLFDVKQGIEQLGRREIGLEGGGGIEKGRGIGGRIDGGIFFGVSWRK